MKCFNYEKLYEIYKKNPNNATARVNAQRAQEKVQPLLKQKLEFEQQLKAYPLYRAAIMAVIPKEGKTCTVGQAHGN